jgi:hypothetical protein
LTLKYKDGEKKIIVPPEAPVVTYTTGHKSDLKPGTKIFIAAAKKLSGCPTQREPPSLKPFRLTRDIF